MKIYIGADHRGYVLKEELKRWLAKNHSAIDVGAFQYDPKDDYPIYAEKVALLVADNNALGIIICGSGVGVNVVANKFDGVRASLGVTAEQVKAGREDDDMNVLVLAADHTKAGEAKSIVKAFLEGKFSGKARHKRRLKEIERIEANN